MPADHTPTFLLALAALVIAIGTACGALELEQRVIALETWANEAIGWWPWDAANHRPVTPDPVSRSPGSAARQ